MTDEAGWHERISIDPGVAAGKPVVRDTRLAVEYLLDLLSGGWTVDEILENWPGLQADDVRAVFAYARDAVRAERVSGYRVRA
jgi:uncharacterized protein (DUF433 family)